MSCRDKLGYKYSWVVGDGSDKCLDNNFITDFHLLDKTSAEIEAYKDFKVGDIVCNGATQMKVIYRSGDLVVLQLENGRASKNYTVTELYDDGWRLKSPRPEGKQEEKEVYLPKEGDLVSVDTCDVREYITLFSEHDKDKYPVVRYDVLDFVPKGEICSYPVFTTGEIHPATNFHMDLYAKTLAENGYEYDREKKEVRKKRWRAKHGETYLYVSEEGRVEEDEEYGFEEDYLRHKSGNYFRLSERESAEEAAAEFRKILKHK